MLNHDTLKIFIETTPYLKEMRIMIRGRFNSNQREKSFLTHKWNFL
jgi:hypothetical protein